MYQIYLEEITYPYDTAKISPIVYSLNEHVCIVKHRLVSYPKHPTRISGRKCVISLRTIYDSFIIWHISKLCNCISRLIPDQYCLTRFDQSHLGCYIVLKSIVFSRMCRVECIEHSNIQAKLTQRLKHKARHLIYHIIWLTLKINNIKYRLPDIACNLHTQTCLLQRHITHGRCLRLSFGPCDADLDTRIMIKKVLRLRYDTIKNRCKIVRITELILQYMVSNTWRSPDLIIVTTHELIVACRSQHRLYSLWQLEICLLIKDRDLAGTYSLLLSEKFIGRSSLETISQDCYHNRRIENERFSLSSRLKRSKMERSLGFVHRYALLYTRDDKQVVLFDFKIMIYQ